MKINKNAWHYKLWKKSFNGSDPPNETDLCRYCHKVFWSVLGLSVFFSMVAFLVGLLCYLVLYLGLWQHTGMTLLVGAGLAVLVGTVYLYDKWLNGKRTVSTGVVGSYLSAKKAKVCPLIEFVDGEKKSQCLPCDCWDDQDNLP